MISLFGVFLTLAMVFGGYLVAGGKLAIILHTLPYEMMIIGGAAAGSFLVANELTVVKHTPGDVMRAVSGPKWRRSDYRDALCLMYELLRLLAESPAAVEEHIEEPQISSLFARYPRILADDEAVELICDTMRAVLMNFRNPHEVEQLLERQLLGMRRERLHVAHALQKMADGLPALGIVAAVLGVIKTMASIDKPPEILGQMIGGALVGTFLGVFLAYCLVGPLAERIASARTQDHRFYALICETLIASLQAHPPQMCVEVARRNIPQAERPSFVEIEAALKALKREGARP